MPTRRSSRKPASRKAGSASRFLRALVASATVSFSAATYYLHSGLPAWIRVPDPFPAAPADAQSRAQAPTRFAACRHFFPDAAPPAAPDTGARRELCFSGFAVLYDGARKTPIFVAERLNRRLLQQGQDLERTDRFYAEARLPIWERAQLDDYRGSGYARGHMAPAGDMATEEAMAQSFSLANIVPQNTTQNSGPWSRIEQDTRKYVMRAAGDVYVYTGPIYSDRPKTIGSGVAVPSYVYKVVYDATTRKSWVHWQANQADAQAGAPISYAEFVRRTGLHLLKE
ncbi:DNA/RNA non-specific endonuclease [Bordetella genomosp. 13]|uniref:DNA/RNA non-specific endonuclease n=1 Tax=Bordetella genomosp. 13 TaxID=463040 RepID=UPI0021B4FCFC|nr:DNA/RNA non-specific endonuclease [Bordetella genomosp. 13]